MHVHVIRYLPLAGFAFVMMWLMVKKWDFVKEVLSEKDGRGSAFRVGGMVFILTVAFNELYTTVKTQVFQYSHLVAILVAIGVLWGFVKVADLYKLKFGGEAPKTDKDNGSTTV